MDKIKNYGTSPWAKFKLFVKTLWQIFRCDGYIVFTTRYSKLNKIEFYLNSTLPLLESEIDAIAANAYEAAATEHEVFYKEKILEEAKEILK